MICRNCGTEFKEGIFCPECGTRIEESVNNKVIESEKVEDADIEKNIIKDKENEKTYENPMGIAQKEQNWHQENEGLNNAEIKRTKQINRKAIFSILLGVFSWIGVWTIIIPIVAGILSIEDGVTALKGETKYKKCAIIGIILSVLILGFILLLCVVVFLDEVGI